MAIGDGGAGITSLTVVVQVMFRFGIIGGAIDEPGAADGTVSNAIAVLPPPDQRARSVISETHYKASSIIWAPQPHQILVSSKHRINSLLQKYVKRSKSTTNTKTEQFKQRSLVQQRPLVG